MVSPLQSIAPVDYFWIFVQVSNILQAQKCQVSLQCISVWANADGNYKIGHKNETKRWRRGLNTGLWNQQKTEVSISIFYLHDILMNR